MYVQVPSPLARSQSNPFGSMPGKKLISLALDTGVKYLFKRSMISTYLSFVHGLSMPSVN